MENKKRNIAIDILKFFAVLLITNSHFDEQYVHFKELATGGAIGDALFFFCSGYTLFLGRLGSFDTWYKRRIRRIYPSVFGLGIIVFFFYGVNFRLSELLTNGAGWFVSCIMIYYVALYFIKKYWVDNLRLIYFLVTIVILAWYILFFEPFNTWFRINCDNLSWMLFCQPMDIVWIYQWNYFKWGFFFLFMLMGADIGLKETTSQKKDSKSFASVLVRLIVSCIVFYAIPLASIKYPFFQNVLILSLIPLTLICIYFYQLCQTNVMVTIYNHRISGWIIKVISGLCLEIYLVQPFVRTTALNHLFPFNLLILFVAIVVVAYICRVIGRLFQQTFSSEDGYDWKSILKII